MSDNNHDQFLRLYTAALPALRRYVLAHIPECHAAQDVLQEAALALWNKFEEYDRKRRFQPWAFGVLRNEILRHRRSAARRPFILEGRLGERFAQRLLDVSPELDQRRVHLEECIQRLPERSRKAVEMHYKHSRPAEGIASAIGSTVNAVRILLSRARRTLAECIERADRGLPAEENV